MPQVTSSIGLSVNITVEVDDPRDEDAVEEALAKEGVLALKEIYGIDVKEKDILIFDDFTFDEEEDEDEDTDEDE